jgi:26S proteasome regulatory subunit N12
VIGLYLLYLLSQNKIAEFHAELQGIPSSEHSNAFINVPVSLEQHFVDGNYSKVLSTKNNVPLDLYNFFIDKFVDTVRTEIARSAEVSYKKLSIADAMEVFMIDTPQQLEEFVEKESMENAEDATISWQLDQDYLNFTPLNVEKNTIPATKMMYQVLDYAIIRLK